MQTFPYFCELGRDRAVRRSRWYSWDAVLWRELITSDVDCRGVCARCGRCLIAYTADFAATDEHGHQSRGTMYYCSLTCAKYHRGDPGAAAGRFAKPARRAAPPAQTADA